MRLLLVKRGRIMADMLLESWLTWDQDIRMDVLECTWVMLVGVLRTACMFRPRGKERGGGEN